MIDLDIREFGESIGLENLAFNEDGVIHLAIEGEGNLFFERQNDRIYAYLAKDYGHEASNLFLKALELCDFRNQKKTLFCNPILVEENGLGFMVQCNNESFPLPEIHKTIDDLKELHKKLVE